MRQQIVIHITHVAIGPLTRPIATVSLNLNEEVFQLDTDRYRSRHYPRHHWLARLYRLRSNKSYYVTVAELGKMGDKAYKSNLRVEGFVQARLDRAGRPHMSPSF